MTQQTITKSEPTTGAPSSAFTDFVLKQIGCAKLRPDHRQSDRNGAHGAVGRTDFTRNGDLDLGRNRRRGFVVIETPLTMPPNANRAAQSTWDAVLWVLRTYGTARLADAWMLPRLAEFSPEQMQELIAAMRRLRASGRWPRVTDELVSRLEAMQ
jgi:hypothetical protein